jgi:hypothetical protein
MCAAILLLIVVLHAKLGAADLTQGMLTAIGAGV